MEEPSRCYLLDDLPPELRIRIYEFVFDGTYHTSLLIRSDTKVELISPAQVKAALLRTCKTIYSEAVSILYDTVTFRVQIYSMDGYPSCGNFTHLSRNTLYLQRLRHLELKTCIIHGGQMKPALYLTRTFCEALEQAEAKLSSLRLWSNFRPEGRPLCPSERGLATRSQTSGLNGLNVSDVKLFDLVLDVMDSEEVVGRLVGTTAT